MNEAELAGACWSPDGEFLFCNIFGDDVAGSGGTVAITGPWHKEGALVARHARRSPAEG